MDFCTVVTSILKIWQKMLGDFGTKICYFIRKNMAGNGPLVFRTVLCLNLCQKLVLTKKFDAFIPSWLPFVVFSCYLSCQVQKNSRKTSGLRFLVLRVTENYPKRPN